MPEAQTNPAIQALTARFGAALLLDEPLSRHTSARTGGPAQALLTAHNAADLAEAAQIGWAHGWPVTVIGAGSNILVHDAGVKGLVILNEAKQVRFIGSQCLAESGLGLIRLARLCAERGLSGFEWAVGVPGTVGGGIYGNAGAHGGDMAASVEYVYAAAPDQPDITWGKEAMAFAYRSSLLKREQRRCVILSALLTFTPDDPQAIRARMEEYNDYRKRTQPPGATLGSMFKNPPGDYAGRLIEAAGLKGQQIGGARISEKHANFFLNVQDASAADVLRLIDLARTQVQRQFGVELELEVEIVGGP